MGLDGQVWPGHIPGSGQVWQHDQAKLLGEANASICWIATQRFRPEQVPFLNAHVDITCGHSVVTCRISHDCSSLRVPLLDIPTALLVVKLEERRVGIQFGTNYHYGLLGSTMAIVSLEWLS